MLDDVRAPVGPPVGNVFVDLTLDSLGLTPQELAVLVVLAQAGGRVVSRTELARRAGVRGSARRCDNILVGLRRALGADRLRNVRGRGWALVAPADDP